MARRSSLLVFALFLAGCPSSPQQSVVVSIDSADRDDAGGDRDPRPSPRRKVETGRALRESKPSRGEAAAQASRPANPTPPAEPVVAPAIRS